jgi:predicted MFS family arabinose efflux permease
MGRGLGIMVGPLLGGLLFDLQGHYGAAYLLAVALVCVAIGCRQPTSLLDYRGQSHPAGLSSSFVPST